MDVDNALAENEHLRAAIEQRTAELAVVNAVQQAVAAELDMGGIYDAVGEKLREIFHDADLDIRVLDPDTGLIDFKYIYDRGQRLLLDPMPVSGIFAHVAATGATLVINEFVPLPAASATPPSTTGSTATTTTATTTTSGTSAAPSTSGGTS